MCLHACLWVWGLGCPLSSRCHAMDEHPAHSTLKSFMALFLLLRIFFFLFVLPTTRTSEHTGHMSVSTNCCSRMQLPHVTTQHARGMTQCTPGACSCSNRLPLP